MPPYIAGTFNDLLKVIQHIVQFSQTEAVVGPEFGRSAGAIEDEDRLKATPQNVSMRRPTVIRIDNDAQAAESRDRRHASGSAFPVSELRWERAAAPVRAPMCSKP
jgi:hypothetical protein